MNRKRKASIAVLAALTAALGGAAANAHEFWVEPAAFVVARGGPVGVRLCVADGFEGWSLARNAARVEAFVAAGPAGVQPVVGLDGAEPAGFVRLVAPGGYVIAYRSNRAYTEVPAAEFDRYLQDKGLQEIAAVRAHRHGGRGKVREAYSRHAKALLRMGAATDTVVDRPMGLRLEVLAGSDLLRALAGDSGSFQLLYDGKPLAGAMIAASGPGTPDADQTARTDPDGRASFRFHAPGMWRISAVHMIEATGGIAADWESLWASLTFELPSPDTSRARSNATTPGAVCRHRVAAVASPARQ
jgi:hypothetical protein